jgi:mono/diheme cytochrome c family protein
MFDVPRTGRIDMTRNILIATIFTFLTTVLLGGIFLGESRRLPDATAAITAEQLERGARDYEQYCGAACHGIAGQGGVAFGAPSLNNIVQRYQENGQFDAPNGIKEKYGTMRNYIEATLYSGVRGTPMPAFGAQGTLREDQIRNIASYILSWNGQPPQAAVQTANRIATAQAPTPDPAANPVGQGEVVFTQKGCVGCHNMNDETLVGPGLGGLFQPEGTATFGTQLPNGKEVTEENVREWIHLGSAGFPENFPAQDGTDYPQMPGIPLSDDEWEKLLVWLRVHNRDGSLTEEGEQLQQQQGEPGGLPATEPTVQPTGVPNQPSAPESPAGPGSTATP